MSGNGAYPGAPGGSAGAPQPRSIIDPGTPAVSRRRRREEQVADPGAPASAARPLAPAGVAVARPPAPGSSGPASGGPASGGPASGPDPLGRAFAGRPASTGARLVAFTIDVVLVALVAGGVFAGTRSPTLAAVVALQLAIGFGVALARTGATPGNLLLRLRASRDDAPFSPGTGRAFVRALVTGAGFVVGIGSWIVVASSAWDAGGRRRSWADRAAGTVVVAAPRRGTVAAPVAPAATVAPPLVFSTSARPAVDEDEGPAVVSFAPGGLAAPRPTAPAAAAAPVAPAAPPAFVPTPPAPVAPPAAAAPPAPAPIPQPAAPAPAAVPAAPSPATLTPRPADPARGAMLLIFDTGQRIRIDLPAVVNLGRRPAPSDPGDLLVVVDDPDSTVSKTHLRLEHSRGRTWATDLGSTNGSGILADDGRRTELAPGARTLLDDGDRVRVGDRMFTVSQLMPSAHDERGGNA
ncbi:RDD family protein [Microbacterium sp. ASV81]|uniref:RDD family protein n=1 Tax=Microbacterium capsulatum TaxID=3041921 RepID=A0ABU0XNE4_9MICO|nr:RDD family protein [Microbacterium sp. ASV81]MDQ4215255.1 RDD family protein [Microbacterium sp. ASV81]